MTLSRDSKRRIVVATKQLTNMGQVATCFRSAAATLLEEVAPLNPPENVGDGGKRGDMISFDGDMISFDGDNSVKCEKENSKEAWSEEDDGWSDEGAWSDEDTSFNLSDELWDSFNNCTNMIPYADEYVEQQISIANVRLANEKSEEIYTSSTQVSRCRSMKRVQFLPEPNLVTVISV